MVTLDQAGRANGSTQLFEPPASLDDFAEFFWAQTVLPGDRVRTGWRIVADNNAHVIVSRVRPATGSPYTRVSFVGPRSRFTDADHAQREWVAGVRLKVGVLPLLTGLPASDFADRSARPSDIVGPAGTELSDRLREVDSPIDAARVVGSFLERRLRNGPRPDNRVVDFGKRVVARPGGPRRLRVRDVARDIGLAERTLRNLALETIGLPPVVCLRVERLHTALHLALGRTPHMERRGRDRQRGGWARVAVAAGYFDQAHMNRDFNALLGETPRHFISRGVAKR